MKDKNGIITLLISLLIYLSIFIASLFVPQDPDLGWHLKYGEYFFEHGSILRDNNFSVLMPDYKWNNSSWATDLLTYQTFHNFGFLGLSALGAVVITLTFFFFGKASRLSLFEESIIFPMIFYFVSPVNEIAFRGQLLSLLLMAVLYFILAKYETNKKIVILLIPLFMVWGNLHGQYILGLGIFLIWITIYTAKEIYLNYKTNFKKFFDSNKYLIMSFVGSFFAVLINPYGLGVYREAIGHFDDPLQKSVIEFLAPADFSVVWWHLLLMSMVLVIGIPLLGLGKKNLDKAPFYFPSLVLYVFTFWVRRYAWPFYYSCIFLLQPVIKYFEPNNKKYSVLASGMIAILFLISAGHSKYPISSFTNMNWDTYCINSVGCSPTAAAAVIDNKLNNEKLLTIYDYGGWLIWNYPQIKPTIDGRMHLWRDEKGNSGFEYYYPIEQNLDGNDIDKSPYNTVLTSKRKPIYKRLQVLQDEGKWRAIHIDNYSAVFIRK